MLMTYHYPDLGLTSEFNSKFPTSIPITFMEEAPLLTFMWNLLTLKFVHWS